jgi:hypothetical protein
MPRLISDIEQRAIPLPITTAARQAAAAFAWVQPTPARADAVWYNSLAVWVMRDYCQMMDIPTALSSSDSWNPLMQLMADVADLRLPNLGQLECRPLREGATACPVPPEVWDLRIGYVVVAIAEDYQSAKFLGFTPNVQGETLSLEELQPPEALLDHLHALGQSAAAATAAQAVETVVNLGRWLQGLFGAGWQAVDAVLPPEATLAISFRNGGEETVPVPTEGELAADVSRARLIDLAIQLGLQQVVLLVDLQAEDLGPRHIRLQVHPAGHSPYLPQGLELAVLEADGVLFMQAQAREADNFIQLQFSGQPGESFRVQIRLENAEYGEDFVM